MDQLMHQRPGVFALGVSLKVDKRCVAVTAGVTKAPLAILADVGVDA
jgi:hypothetical protein